MKLVRFWKTRKTHLASLRLSRYCNCQRFHWSRDFYAWVSCVCLRTLGAHHLFLVTMATSSVLTSTGQYANAVSLDIQLTVGLLKWTLCSQLLFIHSFIADIYIAPLQVGLLRSAANPSAAEQFLGEYSRKWPEGQWDIIPDQRANHKEGPAWRRCEHTGHERDLAQPSGGGGYSER